MKQERDESLMEQAAGGRTDALDVLVRRYASPLLTFIRRMIGDYHRSEELFQEVFVAVWRKRKQFDGLRRFKPWLYAIAVNACRDEFRRRRVVTVPVGDELIEPDGGDDGGDVAVMTEHATLVVAAVATLPIKQRAVVALRVWSGFSYAEIAEVLGRSEATARVQMHDALKALRAQLEPRMR
jgi:RNA polymerase sigma-70 factor (ECF subfamily)